ncbi:MAG: hypothetical protein Q7S16_01475 [bacterium]|nr:hypothetical protein [bacterium]
MSLDQKLVEQFTQVLAQSSLTDEEKKSWEDVVPELTDEELVETVANLQKFIQTTKEMEESIVVLLASAPPSPRTLTPAVVRELTGEKLANPATFDVLRSHIQLLESTREFSDAREFGKALHDVAVKYLDYASQLEELIDLTKFIRLSELPDTERRSLFEHSLLVALRSGFNVIDLIDLWLDFYSSLPSLAESFAAVLAGLRENNETIGDQPLQKEEERTVPPTIKNWFIEYQSFFPLDKPRGAVERANFIAQNKNAQHLSLDERALLEKVFEIIDNIFFPELHIIRQEVVAHDAIPAPLSAPVREHRELPSHPLAPPIAREPVSLPVVPVIQRSATIPPPADAERVKKIDAARARLRETGKEAVVLFFDLLSHPQGMTPATSEELAAGLMILAQDNAFERAITDAKIRELFLAYLKSKNQPDLLEGFRLTPTMPKFMTMFLQWVLQEKGKLSENDAAHIGARIATMLKKRGNEKYSRIAYLDAASGSFRWS